MSARHRRDARREMRRKPALTNDLCRPFVKRCRKPALTRSHQSERCAASQLSPMLRQANVQAGQCPGRPMSRQARQGRQACLGGRLRDGLPWGRTEGSAKPRSLCARTPGGAGAGSERLRARGGRLWARLRPALGEGRAALGEARAARRARELGRDSAFKLTRPARPDPRVTRL